MARSKELVPGIGRLSRTQVKDRRGLWKGPRTSTKAKAAEQPAYVEKRVGGEKNGGVRLVPTSKAPRYYPAEDVRKPKKSRKVARPTKLRPSISPGTVLIILAGRFAGKRVVFLKQLDSGLLLVTGPYKINGVPLRRINQAYVIATRTKVDLGDSKVPEDVNDAFFAKAKTKGVKSAEEEFFSEGKPKSKEALAESKVNVQKEVDATVLSGIKEIENLSKYLKASFGFSKGQFPHQMVF